MGSPTEGWRGFPFLDLPEGIDENILAKIQARDSYRNCRLVCRSWYDIISRLKIVHQQQRQLLIGSRGGNFKPAKSLHIEITSSCELDYKFKIKESGIARWNRIIASCNGLVLVNNIRNDYKADQMQIMNILTGDYIIIPAPPSRCCHRRNCCTMGLGYDLITKTYKVVHLYVFSLGFEVLTVKWPPVQPEEEQWRSIPGPWFDDCDGKRIFQVLDNLEPVYTGRVLHWSNGSDKYIVSMDVGDDQKPFRTKFPVTGSENYIVRRDEDNEQILFKKRCSFSLVEIDGDLGFLHNVSDSRIDVWIMEEPRGLFWSKKHSIDSGMMNYMNPDRDPLPKLGQFGAVCSLGSDGEVLVLKQHSSFQLYVYDSRNNVLQKIKVTNFKKEHFFIPHRPSLAALDTDHERLCSF